ncbi:MAG: hypothetical protein ABL907_06185 [Hyphomicrobium sp.]
MIAGFIAGALAVLIFHQGMYVLIQQLLKMGMLGAPPLGGTPWNLGADPGAYGMPRVLNQAFWGGLWGIVFAHMIEVMPGPNWLRGFIFGCIFPMLLGSWLVVAMIKGTPLMSNAFAKGGFNIMSLRNGFLLNGVAFGIGLGLLYPWLASMIGGRSTARA